MKNYCLLLIATFVSLNSVAAATRLKVADVVGSYEYADNSSCTESETGLPCLAAFVTLDEQGGVIYSKKLSRGGSVPAIKLYVKKDYPFPDEDDAPEGETTEVEKFVLRR